MEEINEIIDDSAELFEHHRLIVEKGQKIIRIDKYLNDRIENASRTKIQNAADAGNILVNEIAVKPSYKVKPLDVISILMDHPPREIEIIPEDIPLNILYEDDEVIIINKAPGMVVHPSFGHYQGTLINALAFHLKDSPLFTGSDIRPGMVHRIDKDTSGIIVIAKSLYSKNHLGKQFFDHTVDRKYYALVWGSFDHETGTITGHIGRSVRDRKVFTVYPEGDQGKHAITHYKVLEHLGYVTLVECKLETGRTHQIRVHMRNIGHPLFNDPWYGGDQILKGTTFTKYKQFVQNCFKLCPRQALHAKTLGFMHPVKKEFMMFSSELPDDMVALLEKWRNYIAYRHEFVD
jgi:23S rRNA pseudouridine1911/1915/1917 synthase